MHPEYARELMIQRLQRQGIKNPLVLTAMQQVPRHLFIDEAFGSHAYSDYAMPIGQGQTISQPYIVAYMTELLLQQGKRDKVLEIGTGCGYQTAILAQLFKQVYSIERIGSLSNKAELRLAQLGIENTCCRYGDGYAGWVENAPYPAILVTAAPEEIPIALLDQLAIGGFLIIPVGKEKSSQQLLKIVRTRSHYEQHILDEVSFVPLRGGLG
jgi:protein-L-isoaspartate(D-aspartate) O-methyltransferase